MVAKSVTRRRSFYWDGLEGIFPDLAELISFTEAEVWFPFVALADDVTPDIIEIAMRAGGARIRPLDGARFAERLWQCGVLAPSDTSGASGRTVRRFVEPVRNGLLSALQATYRGLAQPTRMMLDVGLALRLETAHVQLALWARDVGAWAELEQLWSDYWPEFWGHGRRVVTRAYANIPLPVLRTHPNLAYTDAIFRARPGDNGAESRRYLERDGMLAEATWQSLVDPDAALAGATLSIGAINRRGDFAHAAEIVALATKHVQLQGGGRANKTVGKMLTPVTVANFSVHAATTSLLNGELRKALLYTDQAMMFSEGSLGHAGPVAAGIQTLVFAIEGDRRRYEHAQGVFRERDLPGMPGRRLIHLPVRLAEALTAIRMLDREAAEVALSDIHPEIENSELWFIYEWLRAKMEDFWGDPVIGLAHLDSAAAVHSAALDNAGLPRSIIRRARSELLLAMKQANKAVRGINGLEQGKIPRELLVPLCRAFLAAGEGRQAAIVAETGIDDPRVTLVDRLQLLVIKAAGQLHVGGGEHRGGWGGCVIGVQDGRRDGCPLGVCLASGNAPGATSRPPCGPPVYRRGVLAVR